MNPHLSEAFAILRLQDRIVGKSRRDMEDVYSRVIAVLDRIKARWTLIGAHAVNSYARPRATANVDLVIEGRRLKSILAALDTEFGALDTADVGAAIRISNLAIDLVRSDNHPLFRAALDDASTRDGVRVPPPELLVVLKYLAAMSPWRDVADRKQDVVDLIRVYRAVGDDFDRERARAYAGQVYPGADGQVVAIFDRIDRGEDIAV